MNDANDSSCVGIGDESYLSPAQLEYFRDRLLQWRRELCRNLAGETGPVTMPMENLPDWVDSATHSALIELSLAEQERSLALIRQIDTALQRIAAGSFGYCLQSGEEIGLRRLMALPIARYSVEIQSEIERGARRCR